jgi:hypothetical protein
MSSSFENHKGEGYIKSKKLCIGLENPASY